MRTRSFFLLLCLALFSHAATVVAAQQRRAPLDIGDGNGFPFQDGSSTGTGTSSSSTGTTSSSTTTTSDTSTSTTSTSTTSDTSTTTTSTTTSTTSTTTSTADTSTSDTNTSLSVTSTQTDFTTAPNSSTASSTSDTATAASSTSSNTTTSGSGFGTGSIIGLSVAGGVAVLGIIGFFVWKLTRKRMSDFDDNEAIKWPELNAHNVSDSHPLPVHDTGRAGFETGSEVSLSRENTNYSTTDFSQSDPYSVPPLPHLNPNQPYRDDPSQAYYDPYRGPVPNTLNDPAGNWAQGAEAIPMTQLSGAGRMSPGPGMMYDAGRASPAPGQAYGGGRASPGPAQAYGLDAGRASPGPGQAYGASPSPQYGRSSPGPQAAYDAYTQPR